MSGVRKLVKTIALSSLIFGNTVTGVMAAPISRPTATTSATKLAQRLKQETPKAQQTVEDNGFKFELQNCQRATQRVTCSFLITNIEQQDRDLTLWVNASSNSRIFDSSGNEYIAKEAQLGRDRSTFGATTRLIRSIPAKASVSFDLPQELTKLAVLEVGYDIGRKLQFRDVSIVGSKPVSSSGTGCNCTCPRKK